MCVEFLLLTDSPTQYTNSTYEKIDARKTFSQFCYIVNVQGDNEDMFQTLITKATTQVFFKSWYFTLIVPQYDIITLWLNHISSIVNFEYFSFSDLGRSGGLGRFRLPPTAPIASGLVTNRNLRKKMGSKLVILPYSLLLIGKLAKPQAGPSLERLPGSLPNRGRLRDGKNDGNENDSNIFWQLSFRWTKNADENEIDFFDTFTFTFFQVKHFISCPASLEEKYSMMRLADLLKRNKKVGFFPLTFERWVSEFIKESGAAKS